MRGKRIHILITFCLLLLTAGSQQAKAQDRFDNDSLSVTKTDSLSVVVDTTFSKKKKTVLRRTTARGRKAKATARGKKATARSKKTTARSKRTAARKATAKKTTAK